jgi:hypothetical protein
VDADRLARLDQIGLLTRRRDGSFVSRSIWLVVVAGEAYIRSAFGARSAWYRRARREGRVEIEAGEETLVVGLTWIDDEALNARISDTYRAKYSPTWPGPTETLTGVEACATTMRLELS